jgi:hypothetical protein
MDDPKSLPPGERPFGYRTGASGQPPDENAMEPPSSFFATAPADAAQSGTVAERSRFASQYASSLPDEERAQLLVSQFKSLPPNVQEQVVQLSGISAASQKVSDRIWLIVIATLSAILAGAFVALAIGMFFPIKDSAVKPELVFAIFTSIVGFLGGVFAPSPLRKTQ